MLRIITNNWPAKLVCLLIAIGLWVYVASGESRVDNFPGTIPLEVRNAPEDLVVIKDVNLVELRIVAERSTWKNLSSDSFKAYLNLSALTEGTNEVSVTIETNISGIQIVEIRPAKVLVRLETIESKKVPVEIKVEGSAGEGLVPGDPYLEPNEVTISGAKSIIEQISKATGIIRLDGEEKKVEKTVTLEVYDQDNQKINDISIDPPEIGVSVPIIKGATSKTVGISVQIEGQAKSGYWISEIITDPTTTVITSSGGNLGDVNYINTEKVNVDGLDSERTQTVKLSLPEGISIVSGSAGEVTVTLKVSTTSINKEVTASYNYGNLADNLKISSIDPQSIRVVLSGSSDKLNKTDSSNVSVGFNLENYKTGTYSIDITKEMIKVPEGVQVVSFVPSAVRITLENK